MDIKRQFRTLLMLIFILLTIMDTSLAKQHPVRHAHSRHKRQHRPRTFVPDHYIMDGAGGPEYGDWGHWSEPSECSRTCGGGVAFQTRHCRDIGSDGNILCHGGSKRYFSCNIEDCPEGGDFRSEQCAEFNRVPIDNKFYDWIPYTNAPNQCELNCMPRGERFFYRHKRKVADGTRCDDERLDICVDGQCLPVGCDRMLGSDAREDICRQCRGDGTSCTTVEGVLDNDDLQVGYNDILLIPAGATNIKVKEIQPTNNYLAIRNTTGFYYLNGNWRIDFPRDLPFIGTIFHYERKPHKFYAPESISALGPTTEAIYICLLYQEKNPGIMYEYSIPKGVSPHFLAENYTWVEGAFGPCSRTCGGGGVQKRYVQCVRKSDNAPVSSDLCDSYLMPPATQECALDSCPPEWTTGQWSPCSESCEKGFQERQVYCTQVVANGLPTVVDEDECAQRGPKPETKQECNVETICPSWHIGPWKPCNRLCGDGQERRDVVCYRKIEGKIEILDERYCAGEKPESEKPCMIRPCDGVDWITSEWSGCDEKCGLTQETRTVQCATQSGVVFPDSFCHQYRIPELVRECQTPKKCEHEWYAGQWSQCSSKCGSGIQTRKVFCGMIDENGLIKKVEDDKCDIAEKYESEQNCFGMEECKGDWFSGPWSQCTKACGGGQKTRKVLCLQDNQTVPVTDCDGNSVPFSVESCNDHSCGEDEMYTIEPQHDLSEDDEEDCEEEEEITDSIVDMTSPADAAMKRGKIDSVGSTESTFTPSGLFSDLSTISPPSTLGFSPSSFGSSTSEFSSTITDTSSSDSSTVGSSSTYAKSSSLRSSTESVSELTSLSSESSQFTSSSFSTSGLSSFSSSESSSQFTSTSDLSTSFSSSSSLFTSESSTSEFSSESSISDVTSESSSTSDITSDSSTSDITSDSSSTSDATSSKFSSTPVATSESSSTSDSTSESSSTSDITSDSSTSDAKSESSSTSDITSDSSTSDATSESSSTSDITSDSSTSGATSESSSTSDITSESSSTSDITSESSSTSDTTSESSSTSDVTSESSSTSDVTSESSSTSDTTSESSSTSDITSESSSTSDVTSESSSTSDTTTESSSTSDITSESSSTSDITSESSPSSSTVDSSSTSESSTAKLSSTSDVTSSVDSTTPESSSSYVSSSSTVNLSPSSSTFSYSSTSSSGTSSISSSDGTSASTSETSSSLITDGLSKELSTTLKTIGEVESDKESTVSSFSMSDITSFSTDKTESSVLSSTLSTLFENTSDYSSSTGSSFSTGSSPELSSLSTDLRYMSYVSASASSMSGSTVDMTSPGWSTSDVSKIWGSTVSSIQLAITKEQKLKKCKPKKTPACVKSEFGCCPDGITPAQGPFTKGCPQPETCEESKYGCCSDGVSPALGKKNKGCPPSICNETLFGCCLDGFSISQGNDYEGCPEEILPVACSTSQFGCCPDNMTSATGPDFRGCFVCEGSGDCETCNETKYGCCPDNLRAASGPDFEGCEEGSGAPQEADCAKSTYGCCPDGILTAEGPNYENCGIAENCTQTYYGCCPDNITPAQGPRYEGCRMPCESEPYGCCSDNYTPAHGPNKEGCCLMAPFGCCPDNILYARGPNFEGCGCQYSPFGCCPDNYTAARGYNNEGCGCQYTEHGCCPNNYTPAAGPNFQGCPCYTFQFGCCPDGVTTAKGPQRLGCGCENKEFGCCPDGKTPAEGPDFAGCGCEASRFGCCPDGVTESQGEFFQGCTNVPLNPGEICKKEKDRGTCRDFTVKWYYDMEYGGCSRFWYGGCEGNDNRFRSAEECRSTCVEPEGKDRCSLPKVEGPCEGYYPKWYYDTTRKQCGQFIYSGCLGNNNNFETREECQQTCASDQILDVCDQEVEAGPCQGSFRRWYYNKNYKMCMEFHFGGCKPNGNNFLTQSACIEQCVQPGRMQDHCSLPRDTGNCTDRQPRWFFDYAENRCMPFYYTGCGGNGNRFETLEACEEDCPPRVYQDVCMQPALVGECHNYTERWYYDAQAAYCKPFYYGGCGGNHNNFESQSACQRRCEPGYEPIVEETPPPPTRAPEVDPFRTEYCFYDSDPGPCREEQSEPKWFYDRTDGVCKQFLYGGCRGNRNRFDSREECEYNCGQAQDLCLLPKTVGPCNGNYRQWYYDRQSDSCYEFDYGGCLGNENRFNTRYDCEIRCKQGPVAPPTPPTTIPPSEPGPPRQDSSDICHASVDPGPCLDERPAWYFDPQTRSCQAFVYGGCGGNANRFDSEEQCQRQCGEFRGQDVCNIQHDPGTCRQSLYKWYYDAEQRACKQFVYGGCDGNGNRFSSIEECETICLHREEIIPASNETDLSQAICRLPMEVGPCADGHYKRWYFDERRGTCSPFIYSGCGGNFNRFKNFDTCVKFCTVSLRDLHPPPLYEEPDRDPNEIIPADFCEGARQECQQLHCPYGIEKYIDSQDCERCRCNDPCREHYCSEGTRCAVDLFSDLPNEIHFRSVCREEHKPGQCPVLAAGSGTCTRECISDADCQGYAKCCETGCGASCVHPVPITQTTVRTYETQRTYYPGAQPPSIVANEPEVTSEEGSYATLKCIAYGVPVPVVTWRKNNTLIDGSSGRHRLLADGSLQIIGLYRSDAGVYYCMADNGVGNPAEKYFTLVVTDPVERPAEVVGEENKYIVVTLGSPTILQCYVIGWPRPKIIWWRGDQILPLSYGQYEQRRDFSLLLKTVSLKDLGPYVCQAYNGLGKAVSGIVTVQAIGPVFSNNREDEQFFQYLVSAPQRPAEPPTPRPVYWPPPRTTSTYPVVHIETTPRHTTPEPQPQPEPKNLTQPEAPRVYTVPLSVNISLEKTNFPIDSDISIPCDVDGYPIPRITWYKNGETLQSSRKIEITESNRLRIIRADGGDSGVYTCEAENQFERVSSEVKISVEGIYVHPNCTDNVFFANCELIVKAQHCQHKYYARFCCRSCTQAGQLPSYGPHLDYLGRRLQE